MTDSQQPTQSAGFLKNHLQLILNIIFAAAIIFCIIFYAVSRPKIGFVDSSGVLSQTVVAQDAFAELQATIAEYENEIAKQEQEITVLRDIYEKTEDKQTIGDELQTRMAAFETYITDVREELAQVEAEIMAPVYEAINTALDDYGKTHGYSLILGATPSGNILFGDNQADLTAEFIEYLDGMESPAAR